MLSPSATTALLAGAFVLLWNSGFIGAEYGLPYTGPLTLLWWRYLALAGMLACYLAFRRRLRWPGVRVAGHAAVIGALAHGVWLGCVLVALQRGVPAGIVALVVALQPLATGALTGVFTGERVAPAQWLGLVVGFAGVGIAVGARLDPEAPASAIGLLAPFGSVAAITLASLLERRQSLRQAADQLSLDRALLYQSLGTLALVGPPAIGLERLTTAWTAPFLTTMAWLVVGVSLAAYALMWILLRRTDATRVASLFYLGPPVTAVMAWIAFGDRPWATDWLGMAVVALGVAAVQWGRPRRAPASIG